MDQHANTKLVHDINTKQLKGTLSFFFSFALHDAVALTYYGVIIKLN